MPASDPADPGRDSGPFVVAVTGGIGSGKSRVARTFEALGARVIDADEIARAVVDLPEVREALTATFGERIFTSDGALDRARLASLVFEDPAALGRLNQIVHPEVRRRIDKELARFAARGSDERSPLPGKRPLVLLDIPLLETSPYAERADVVLFVDAPEADRRRRVFQARGWSPEELARREASQMPLAEKRRRAHRVIPNPDDAADPGSEALGELALGTLEARCRALVETWERDLGTDAGS